ncbi:MAG TPA: transporter substrate-binding domain-containing protein, partial [Opitutus sp.]|nr:transporter substrate-binding domain-containing protein [Opitutus sp.]
MLHHPGIRRWLGLLTMLSMVSPCARSESSGSLAERIELTAEEQAWVAAHPVIKVGADPDWPPFSSLSDGRTRGIDPDLLTILGTRLGLQFEFVTRPSWLATYAAAESGEIDVLVGTARTTEREKTFQFTEPYFSFPVVIVTRTDETILWSVLDLAGRRVVGVRGYVATAEMARLYPQLDFLPDTESVATALQMVSSGDADAFITNLPNASFTIKTLGLTNVKIAGVMPDRFNLCYGVRADWPQLTALLNRGIASLSEADRQSVVHPWIRVDYAKVIRWDLVWKTSLITLGVLGTVLGTVVYHNRRMARELVVRKRLQGEIKEAHDRLLQLNADKTELLQMAAHDLRGPLTGIQLAIHASAQMNAVPTSDALNIIDKQVRQMTGLLSNLLDVEALEHGSREFDVVRLEPDAIVREALSAFEAAAAQKSIQLESFIAEDLPPIEADALALRQITDNLLSNAIKFSPRGSVVQVVLEQQKGFVRFAVRDQGPGVAPSETERIFVKYARGTAQPTDGEKSTGLGLSIVRKLAGGMNARVWCESGPVQGST